MTIDEAVARIQFAYPQVYFACHTRHGRRRSNGDVVSAADVQVLVHLDRDAPATVTALARHLGLASSTLSAALTRLAALGYVAKAAGEGRDRRQVLVTLTRRGAEVVHRNSVLEPARLRRVLRRMGDAERARAVAGLDRLARACRRDGDRRRGTARA